MNNNKINKIPKFKNEDQEREFWAKNVSSQFVNWGKAAKNPALPKLKPSTRTISLRLPLSMLDQLKTISNCKDIPYQSYIKAILDEQIKKEFRNKKTN